MVSICDAESHFNDSAKEKYHLLIHYKKLQKSKNIWTWKVAAIKVTPKYKKLYQYCYHWGKKVICLTGVFSGKVIDFINEPSIWRSFLKNVFADDGNILVTNRFDRNIYCTLSRGLRIVLYLQEIEVYSLIQHLFVLQWLLNSKEFQFITKNM